MAARIANSSVNPTEPLAIRFGAAQAKAYRSLDEFRRKLRKRGIDPDSVIGSDPFTRVSNSPEPKTISTNDPDWRTFFAAWKSYEEMIDEWRAKKDGLHSDYLVWREGRLDELEKKYGRLEDRDLTKDKDGQPNNPQDVHLAIEHVRELDLFEREDIEQYAQTHLPKIGVPQGWRGRLPFYQIETLADVEPWLERAWKHARNVRLYGVGMDVEHCEDTAHNLRLLAGEFRILDRPNHLRTLSGSEDVELIFDQMLLWVQRKLALGDNAVTSRVDWLTISSQLEPAVRNAYLSYAYVETKVGRILQDRDAHTWLHENGIDQDQGDLGDLSGYELPNFDTWSRQLRTARNALGEQKYQKRRDRKRSRGIIHARDL